MSLSDEARQGIEDARRELAQRSPEEHRRAASFVREFADGLDSPDSEKRMERVAQDLEARADAAQSSPSSSAA